MPFAGKLYACYYRLSPSRLFVIIMHHRYPPVSFITRTQVYLPMVEKRADHLFIRCRKDVALTTSTPINTVDGAATTEIPIPAETDLFISIIASNRNPAIWGPDSLEWKPERWLSSLPKSVADAKIPGVYANL